MSPRWIFARAYNDAYHAALKNGTFMQALGIINTGLEGIEQRAVRFSLRLSW